MPNIKAKNYYGEYVTRENADKVYFESADTEGEKVPFTYGEVVEDVQIIPDFSAGDMTVAVEEGKLLREVTVVKPETLVPENVAKDVEIAGIVGTHEGGGSGNITDENQKYFACTFVPDDPNAYLQSVDFRKVNADTGNCDISIPTVIAGRPVIIVSDAGA